MSSYFNEFWTPAFAGVTLLGTFYEIIKFDEGTTAEKMASPQMPVGAVREPPQHWPGKADIVFLPIGWKFDSP